MMIVDVLSYEIILPDGSMIEVDGYDDIVSSITKYNKINSLINGGIIFPSLFDFVEMIMSNSKVELVVNDVILGTISKVVKQEEI